uniref:Uncharacterized protein n=2 Tax=Phakopsora pachyrhizi TaxID=170000 RepID=A0A0S1MJ88_PHAPC
MISSETSIELLDHSLPQSDKLLQTISLNLDSIKFGLPTQYIFTKTSQAGKTGSLRADYFRRHIRSITDHLVRLKKNGGRYLPETEAKWGNSPRQLVWLIIEDGEKLSESIRSVLENENGLIPYVYYVYGPTHRYGNAQQNSAYALIHRMVSYLGHGPVVSIDDDGKVLPELFDIVWRVRRLGVWPMGNLTPFKWEGPEYDEETHEFKDWLRSESDNRPFPLDNGAFAFSSQVFGTNHRLKGPRYWPTDYPGGESEFVSQILPRQDLVEPLCYNCRVAWHNQALKPDCVAHLPTCDEF